MYVCVFVCVYAHRNALFTAVIEKSAAVLKTVRTFAVSRSQNSLQRPRASSRVCVTCVRVHAWCVPVVYVRLTHCVATHHPTGSRGRLVAQMSSDCECPTIDLTHGADDSDCDCPRFDLPQPATAELDADDSDCDCPMFDLTQLPLPSLVRTTVTA